MNREQDPRRTSGLHVCVHARTHIHTHSEHEKHPCYSWPSRWDCGVTSPHWTLVAQGSRSFLAFLGFVLLCTPPPQPTPPTPAPALLPSLKKALSVGCWPMKGLTDKSIIAATQVPTRSGLGVKHSFACAEPLRTQPHPSSVGSVGPAWEFYCLLGRPCPSWPPHVHCAATAASQCSSHGGGSISPPVKVDSFTQPVDSF